MNKQELKEQISSLPTESVFGEVRINKNSVLRLINQLDEPQKVVIPKLLADWIEECKAKNYGIGECITNSVEYAMPDEVIAWFGSDKETEKDKDLLVARAYLDGYEIEQEKLYTVEIPNPHSDEWSTLYLAKGCNEKLVIHTWSNYTSIAYANNWKFEKNAHLTEAEIRKDFEWAWQWAEPVGGGYF